MRASTFRTLTHVVLPLIKPAVVTALVYSFVRAMTTVSAVIFLTSAQYEMATVFIINRAINGDYGIAIAYSTALIAMMMIAIGIIQLAVGERKLGRRAIGGAPPALLQTTPATGSTCMTMHPASGTRAAEVRLRNVSKRYGNVTAVKPLDLTIPAGSLVTLLGPSGCGKTTLLRMIAGLERVSDGEILIGGQDVTQLSAGERNVSMVFQSYALFPHMNVLENVAYGLISGGTNKKEAHARAEDILALVGLKGFGPRLPSEMSGGQQQRVAVARALVLKPDVLLFDEPLSNLDARLRRSMREEIRALQQDLGVTVVYVTHDQSEALAVSDIIVVMRSAEIAQVGTPRELYGSPDNVFVATFMGEANHVKGVLAPASASSRSCQSRHAENRASPSQPARRRSRYRHSSRGDPPRCGRQRRLSARHGSDRDLYGRPRRIQSRYAGRPAVLHRAGSERLLRKVGEAAGVMLDAGGVFAVRA